MNDLISRGLLGSWLTTDLDAYSTMDIIDEIKRVVCGPLTWLPKSASPPTLHREFKFLTDLTMRAFSDIQLIPGGSHAILTTRNEFMEEKWHASYWCRRDAPKNTSPITIQELYLRTGESQEVFRLPLPPGNFSNRWWAADLRGLLIIHLTETSPRGNLFLLVDWCNGKQVILTYDDCGSSLNPKPKLLRDFVLVTYQESASLRRHVVAATEFTALEAYWHPLNMDVETMLFHGRNGSVTFGTPRNPFPSGVPFPVTVVAGLEFETTPLLDDYICSVLSASESPVRHDAYKIMLYMISNTTPWSLRNNLLLTYTFKRNPAPGSPPTLTQASSSSSFRDWAKTGMSYAGYILQRQNDIPTIMDLKAERAATRDECGYHVAEANPEWKKVYFSDGAVIGVMEDGSVVVSYFK
ncbi:hypothetical protein C8R45DRAFT_929615 [Mycena sanguinolenta]|nr:hypothetical protein C8R45DRAFT_929615 [Mycena sanguinolenta]